MLFIRPLFYAATATVVIGVLAVGWSGLSSYLRTSAHLAGDSLRSQVPTHFEIERLSTLVDDLDATLATQRGRLVKQQVDLDYLRDEVRLSEEQVQQLTAEVTAAQQLLAQERTSYELGGRQFSRERVIAEAQNKAEALVRTRGIAEAKAQTLGALEQALIQADEQIAAAARQRQTYAMRLAELRANAEQVAMRQELVTTLGTLPGEIDKGAFSRVEESFARIEREIEVQNRLLDRQQVSPSRERITFGEEASTDIMAVLGRALQGQAVADSSAVPADDQTVASTQRRELGGK